VILGEKSRVLDLGCGCGVPVARDLAAAGHEVIGVDVSEVQLQRPPPGAQRHLRARGRHHTSAWIHRLNSGAFLATSFGYRAQDSVSGAAVIGRSARLFHWVLWSCPLRLGGQAAVGVGGPVVTVSKSCCHPVSQGQSRGRCRVGRRAEVAIRAGTLIRCARRFPCLTAHRSPPWPGQASTSSPRAATSPTTSTCRPGSATPGRQVDAASGKFLPDPTCTPGAVDPGVTQSNLAQTICRSGYSSSVRAPAAETGKAKTVSLSQYGETPSKTTEYDHLISLELGGTNATSNLWPEPNATAATGFTNPKDSVENKMRSALCSGRITLVDAQKAIATDWTTAMAAVR